MHFTTPTYGKMLASCAQVLILVMVLRMATLAAPVAATASGKPAAASGESAATSLPGVAPYTHGNDPAHDPFQTNLSHYYPDCRLHTNGAGAAGTPRDLVCAQRVAAPGAVRVACVGDSITAVGHTSSKAHQYPSQLQDLLDAAHGNGTYVARMGHWLAWTRAITVSSSSASCMPRCIRIHAHAAFMRLVFPSPLLSRRPITSTPLVSPPFTQGNGIIIQISCFVIFA